MTDRVSDPASAGAIEPGNIAPCSPASVAGLCAANLQLRAENVRLRDEMLQQSAAAESISTARANYVGEMSHILRTPLNQIMGIAHLLRKTALDDDQVRLLDRLESSGKELVEVISDILDVTKIRAGKFELDAKDFALLDMIRDVATDVDAAAQERRLAIQVQATNIPALVNSDRSRLAQALARYMSDAVKFTTAGSVTLRCWTVEQSDTDYLIRFEVTDTGGELTCEEQKRLFAPFEHAGNSTARRNDGADLGLAITKHLAELFGGDVGVTRQADIGSTFWFTARLGRAAEESALSVQPSKKDSL